jgi:hypothetical protein
VLGNAHFANVKRRGSRAESSWIYKDRVSLDHYHRQEETRTIVSMKQSSPWLRPLQKRVSVHKKADAISFKLKRAHFCQNILQDCQNT